ncbi:MAG: hypothetical protein PHD04_01485 [Candidatus Pacebacteria bacterium]|nr:hypothetical protein [Candidatus Paceibacterota bacterium]
MKDRVNAYLGILFITIVGAGASLIIVHIGTTDAVNSAMQGTEGSYAALQQSILQNRADNAR